VRLRWTLLAVGCLVAVGIGAHFVESRLLFPAPPRPAQPPALDGSVEHTWLETTGGRVEAFLLPAESTASGPRPLVVYAHGNGELVDSWLGEFEPLRSEGVSVLLVEYPGYGRSSGSPSERSIQGALAAGYDWAREKPLVDPDRIVGYGRSLGGGAICALGRVRSLAALVLESTFTSIRDIAADRFGVPGFLVQNGFENLAFVSHYTSPVLLIHGVDDPLVPAVQARRLADAAPAAELDLEKCGHGCSGQWPLILSFLGRHGLLH
jgi:fermentation-respiration switch protein FrsA (DUF1100 family)